MLHVLCFMISTDFAPNEQLDDALLSLKLLFQPWRWQNGKEIQLVKEQIRKMFFSNIKDLESKISLFLSGRSALYHLLKSLNLPKNSQIIIQAFTCEAVVLPIIAAGFKPVYIDIEKETYSMDISDLEKKINVGVQRAALLPSVLILQHTFGLTPKNRGEILNFAKKNNIFVIEDLAHGFSSNLTIQQFNNSAILLSFGRSKSFSSVFGGAVISKNKKIGERLVKPSYSLIFRCLLYKPIAYLIKSTYNIYLGKIIHKIVNLLGFLIPEITPKEKGGEYDQLLDKAYPNALAILLLNQLKKYPKTQEKRFNACKFYEKKVTSYKLQVTNQPLLRYPILTNDRDLLVKEARKNNIFLGLWYNQVVAPKSLDLNKVYYQEGSCPVAEEVCEKIINLPTNVTQKEVNKIIQLLKNLSC